MTLWIALILSKLFFVFFLFFVAVVCLFFKIDPEHSHETVFFSFNFLIIDFDFEALELIDMHNNDFSELARDLDQVGFLFVCLL